MPRQELSINSDDSSTEGWFSDCSTPTANELIYFTQIIVIFIVVITSLYNLCIQSGDDSLWTALLTSCIGYILPNPKLKTKTNNSVDSSKATTEL